MGLKVLALGGLVGAAWLAWSTEAEACGGTFCDSGPMIMPVDQASETVVFVQDGDYVEAHIQIAIDPNTDAQKFAWLVPMPAAPEFAVGSQPMFTALLAATAPFFYSEGPSCGDDPTGVGFIQSPDGSSSSVDPEISTELVGAFEVSTIEGGTVDAVMAWLGDNGYAQDPAAAPILAEYLAADHVLVAFKLIPDANIAEIHPVVLRYLGDEPCVPIKLTAIAATEDMAVRAFFLGEERYAPTNYRHVELNPLRVAWDGQTQDYVSAVTMAVDEAPGGRGFITEYAGTTRRVAVDDVYLAAWDSTPFVAAAATEVVALLNGQGLAQCLEIGPCTVQHPVVVGMLRKYLPAPPDTNENDFYACLWCYEDTADFSMWDGPAFAAELDARVIDPGRHAATLLQSWPYITRVFTTISAHEMTIDPMFHPNADLPEVDPPARATRVCGETCTEDAIVTLPDGREVYAANDEWPNFPSSMPWAERIEHMPPAGAPVVEVDNRAVIDAELAAWNQANGCDPDGDDSDGYDDGSNGSGITQGGPGSGPGPGGGSDPSGSGEASSSGSAGADGEGIAPRGCGCTATPSAGSSWMMWLVLAGIVRRGRRRGA